MLDQRILERLQVITPEEQAFLDGSTTIDRDLYMQGQESTINAGKLLASGKLMTVRGNTRFVHFPEHTHDYVEVVYMCSGQTTHIVNGHKILLQAGQLLFMNQSATHEVLRSGQEDVGVNFIILPEFFNATITAMGDEETPLRRFLVDCLCGQNTGVGYLHFAVSQVKPVQNLIENLLWSFVEDMPDDRKLRQMTMALLFVELTEHTESLVTRDSEEGVALQVLRCIESDYANGSFSQLASRLHYDPSWLSREIKRATGKTFTQLVQEKRLSQAAFLLKHTDRNVADISVAVGYENVSYFHRLFARFFGKSPHAYRMQERTLF